MTTTTIARRLERLRNRRVDPTIMVNETNEIYKRLPGEDSAVQYTISAMQPIDPEYTRRTIQERDRVEAQLNNGFKAAWMTVTFDYQGSLTNNTHILAHSDIDLLTVETKWISLEGSSLATHPYQGSGIDDLRKIRRQTASILRSAYTTATVDDSGSKSIRVSGGSLRRTIDVISSAYWHTFEYQRQKEKHWMGIKVLDNAKAEQISNKPFLHSKRIDEKDTVANGGLRKLVRLLKSLKYDSDDAIELSSYDIAAIVYNMGPSDLYAHPGMDLRLVKNCEIYMLLLETSPQTRDSIMVPNGTRKVFCAEGASLKGLTQMRLAVSELLKEIEKGLSRSFRKLSEARVHY